jgi:hypothetical protein
MNLWRKIEGFFKPWMMVVAFLLILIFGLSREANAETQVELGATFLSGEYSKGAALIIAERWDRYSLGMGYTYKQEVTDRRGDFYDVSENLFVHGQRHVDIWRELEFGVGVGYFNKRTRWNGSNFVASLSVQYQWEKVFVTYRHWSNAGSESPNMGQDLVTIGWRF